MNARRWMLLALLLLFAGVDPLSAERPPRFREIPLEEESVDALIERFEHASPQERRKIRKILKEKLKKRRKLRREILRRRIERRIERAQGRRRHR
jgi:hypothetical protein